LHLLFNPATENADCLLQWSTTRFGPGAACRRCSRFQALSSFRKGLAEKNEKKKPPASEEGTKVREKKA
jgi:hypothetical protein